jgi:hypothetical protein
MRKSFPVKALVLSAPTDVKLQFWRPGMRRPSSNAGNPTVFIILAMMLGLGGLQRERPVGTARFTPRFQLLVCTW